MWFSHWVTAACPHEKELPWRAGDICQNSARHAVGALQIFREGEGECRRVARPGSCPQRTVTSTQRKPVFCAREKNCIKACLRGGVGVGTSRPLLLHGEDAEIRGSISGAKRRLPWWAREQQRQREALRARPPPASWIGSRQRPWPPGAMTRQPNLGGAAPPPAGSSVSPEGSRQGPGGRVLAGAGDCSGQAASPVQGGGAPVPAVSSARCPLTSLTRCSRTELPGPAWHPWPCPCPTPTQEAKAGLRFSWL